MIGSNMALKILKTTIFLCYTGDIDDICDLYIIGSNAFYIP